jgi:hypothetical protein
MRSALDSLLGRHKSAFLYETLMCVDGSFDADPVEIHRRIQTHYKKYFSVITSSLIQRLELDLPKLGSKAVWESFLQDPAVMIEAYLNPPAGVARGSTHKCSRGSTQKRSGNRSDDCRCKRCLRLSRADRTMG